MSTAAPTSPDDSRVARTNRALRLAPASGTHDGPHTRRGPRRQRRPQGEGGCGPRMGRGASRNDANHGQTVNSAYSGQRPDCSQVTRRAPLQHPALRPSHAWNDAPLRIVEATSSPADVARSRIATRATRSLNCSAVARAIPDAPPHDDSAFALDLHLRPSPCHWRGRRVRSSGKIRANSSRSWRQE